MKKRLLSLCLIGALSLNVAPAWAASDNVGEVVDDPSVDNGENTDGVEMPFYDVAEGSWYYDAVAYVYDEGLMTGTSTTTFAPNTTTTRGMIVSVLYRQAGEPEVSDGTIGTPFEDVTPGAWYADAVYWARANGIVNGYSDAAFGPNDEITREQMAAILYNYSKFAGEDVSARADLSAYDDASEIAGWAEEALSWANAEGLITGMTTTTIAPKASATRAQVAAILERYLNDGTPEEPETPAGETAMLYIGLPGEMEQVETQLSETTPDALIAALAAETGWDLDLAKAVANDEYGSAVVALAADSALYGTAPNGVDAADWPYLLCNSIAETLTANGAAGVRFIAPDGGKIVIENAAGRFHLMPGFIWDYELARDTNADAGASLGTVVTVPNDVAIAQGVDMLLLFFPVEDVQAESGNLTVYDADGHAVARFDSSEGTQFEPADLGYVPDDFNFEAMSIVAFTLPEPLAPGHYSVHLDPASFSDGAGHLNDELLRGSWTFEVADYGVSGDTIPDGANATLTLGQTYTMDLALDGTTVDRVEIICDEDYITSDRAALTSSGQITLTPKAATGGERTIAAIHFYKGDTYIDGLNLSLTIA